jgi:PAS domain-containing protein
LETFYEFIPLFKIAETANRGLVVVNRKSHSKGLIDLRGKTVCISRNTDWFVLNPVVLFIMKKCDLLKDENPQNIPAKLEQGNLYNVIDNRAQVTLSTSFEFALIPEKERQKLKIIGEFPILPEFVAVAGPDITGINVHKLKSGIDKWWLRYADRYKALGMQILSVDGEYRSLLLEAIEGLGYTLNKYIEEYSDLLVSSIELSQKKDLQEMEAKYSRLKNFNEKLVKMYQEVRDSRDRLTKEIESATDNTILFTKEGVLLGCSRPFATMLNLSRQDIIGKEVTSLIETSISTPFQKLIQQIDIGLVRSFHVTIKGGKGTEIKTKMEFSIIELSDSKVILGVISKNGK